LMFQVVIENDMHVLRFYSLEADCFETCFRGAGL
jgi:hypothetical protein